MLAQARLLVQKRHEPLEILSIPRNRLNHQHHKKHEVLFSYCWHVPCGHGDCGRHGKVLCRERRGAGVPDLPQGVRSFLNLLHVTLGRSEAYHVCLDSMHQPRILHPRQASPTASHLLASSSSSQIPPKVQRRSWLSSDSFCQLKETSTGITSLTSHRLTRSQVRRKCTKCLESSRPPTIKGIAQLLSMFTGKLIPCSELPLTTMRSYSSRFTVTKDNSGAVQLNTYKGTLVAYDDFVVHPDVTPTAIECGI